MSSRRGMCGLDGVESWSVSGGWLGLLRPCPRFWRATLDLPREVRRLRDGAGAVAVAVFAAAAVASPRPRARAPAPDARTTPRRDIPALTASPKCSLAGSFSTSDVKSASSRVLPMTTPPIYC